MRLATTTMKKGSAIIYWLCGCVASSFFVLCSDPVFLNKKKTHFNLFFSSQIFPLTFFFSQMGTGGSLLQQPPETHLKCATPTLFFVLLATFPPLHTIWNGLFLPSFLFPFSCVVIFLCHTTWCQPSHTHVQLFFFFVSPLLATTITWTNSYTYLLLDRNRHQQSNKNKIKKMFLLLTSSCDLIISVNGAGIV